MRAMTLRVAVVDDEQPSRETLSLLLSAQPGVEIVGQYGSGAAFLQSAAATRPAVLFLGVEMARLTGFEVMSQLGRNAGPAPLVVLLAGSQHFAAQAFDYGAADYIVKPSTPERIRHSLERIRSRYIPSPECVAPHALLQRIAIHKGDTIHFVHVDEMDWLETAGNYTRLHARQTSFLYRESLRSMESRLHASRFVRIDGSTVVNIERVAGMKRSFRREHVVILRDGTRLRLTAQYRERLQRLIEGL